HHAAREELIRLRPVDELLSALARSTDAEEGKTLLRLLLELKDARAEAAFRLALDSAVEEVRALGALGLHRLGAHDSLAACVATIDDAPDPLHFDTTPSVRALSEMGIPALRAVLPLLEAEDPRTRQHAQKVFELVTLAHVSSQLNPPPLSNIARERWMKLWESHGSYAWNQPEEARREAVRHWTQWLDANA
ncbi:MAG TPA: hypothetical protein VF754_00875, partial [Pyrinomonadaceae bacterium]